MSLFGKKYYYSIPERLTKDEARQRRVAALLTRERQALEVDPARLSPVNKFHLNKLKEFEVKFGAELEARRARVLEIQKRNPSIQRSGAEISAISRLFQLQQRRSALLERAAAERRAATLKASAGDRRFYNPNRNDYFAKTVFGTMSWTSVGPSARRQFKNPTINIPCIQRIIRKEVLFARGHGGRGHRGPRRFNPLSLIGC